MSPMGNQRCGGQRGEIYWSEFNSSWKSFVLCLQFRFLENRKRKLRTILPLEWTIASHLGTFFLRYNWSRKWNLRVGWCYVWLMGFLSFISVCNLFVICYFRRLKLEIRKLCKLAVIGLWVICVFKIHQRETCFIRVSKIWHDIGNSAAYLNWNFFSTYVRVISSVKINSTFFVHVIMRCTM